MGGGAFQGGLVLELGCLSPAPRRRKANTKYFLFYKKDFFTQHRRFVTFFVISFLKICLDFLNKIINVLRKTMFLQRQTGNTQNIAQYKDFHINLSTFLGPRTPVLNLFNF